MSKSLPILSGLESVVYVKAYRGFESPPHPSEKGGPVALGECGGIASLSN